MAKKKSTRKARAEQDLALGDKLTALLYVKGLQPTEAALRLTAIGLSPIQIAPLLGKTANAVSLLISRARKAGQR